jgi:AcrR family transcriptional regulator
MTSQRPQQERSRKTERRLIGAAIELLRSGGLEACTIPAVAEAAGYATGTIYRRFPDKAALMESVCDSILDGLTASARPCEIVTRADGITSFIEQMVSRLIEGIRLEPQLYVALQHFVRTHPDADFRARFAAGTEGYRDRLAAKLAAHPAMAHHADPVEVARFAVMTCAATLQAALLTPDRLPRFEEGALRGHLISMLTRFLAAD